MHMSATQSLDTQCSVAAQSKSDAHPVEQAPLTHPSEHVCSGTGPDPLVAHPHSSLPTQYGCPVQVSSSQWPLVQCAEGAHCRSVSQSKSPPFDTRIIDGLQAVTGGDVDVMHKR